jgi:uncharacterized membrane protein YkoI
MTQVTPLQRKALLLAAALSGFTLVLVGAVAGRIVLDPLRSATVPTAMTLPTPPPTPGPDPVVQALLDQRAAEYQTMIQQANDRLAQANRQLRQAYSAAAVAADRPAAPPPTYLSAERAAQIAALVAPGASLAQMPELVNFQGVAAFEVVLDAGTLYIDAASGQVLYNGVATMVAASGGGGGGGEHEHEHEDEDEEGDDG